MISIIITAWEDPEATKECIKRFLNQDIKEKYEIWVACPDNPTKKVILNYKKQHSNIFYLHQPKHIGKNEIINILMKRAKGNILIFTDGNKFIEKNAVKEILNLFKDKNMGCIGGHPISSNPKTNMFGYWSHLLTNAANKMRKRRFNENKLFEPSATLLAIRNNIINNIPLDVAEDSIIPLMFINKGCKCIYTEKAKVLVKYPTNLKDWIKQKTRTAKSHETLNKYLSKNKRMKTFPNEILYGTFLALTYPKNLKEFIWTLYLFPARLYIWLHTFYNTKIKKDYYRATWSRAKSTIPK